MDPSRSSLIETLAGTHRNLVEAVSGLDDPALDYRMGPGEWSIREVLAHLVDDEMYVMRTRLERIVKEDVPDLAPHDEKRWHAHRNKNRDRLEELLADFHTQRAASLGIIRMLRESDWRREGRQPEYGRFSAETWLSHWAAHDITHLEQVRAVRAAWEKTRRIREP